MTELLDLDTIDGETYRRPARPGPARRLFGGETIGQAMISAGRTVEADRSLVSMQANFLRQGDTSAPVDFRVERTRDGGSFSTRHVEASQHGRAIFLLTATFQVPDVGLVHQLAPPDVPAPEDLPDPEELFHGDELNLAWIRSLISRNPLECRFVGRPPRTAGVRGEPTEAKQRVWLRVPQHLPSGDLLHRSALGYLSDLFLMGSGIAPHGRTIQDADVRMATIDHSVWFREQPDMSEWLLYDQVGLWTAGGRMLCQGAFYDRTGSLIASVTQQALLRIVPGKSSRAAR